LQSHERSTNDLNTAAAAGIFLHYSDKAKDCNVIYDPRTSKKVARGDVHVVDRAFTTRDYFMSLPSYGRLFNVFGDPSSLDAFSAPDDVFNSDIDVADDRLSTVTSSQGNPPLPRLVSIDEPSTEEDQQSQE
jgi:hypothetical protein